MKTKTLSVFILGALLVAGCGGGGGSSNSSGNSGGGASVTTLTLNTAPTAKLTSSQTNSDALAAEIQQQGPVLVAAASALSLPLAVSALPAGTSAGSIDCASLTGTGLTGIAGSIAYSVNLTVVPTVSSSASVTFSSCQFAYNGVTYTFDGTANMRYPRYNSSTDYAMLISYSNFSLAAAGAGDNYSYGPMNGSFTLDNSKGMVTFTSNLADGSVTNIASGGVTYTGTDIIIASATYVYNSPATGGIIKIEFNNWDYAVATGRPVSGAITVTGANGDTVSIVANGADYTVTYTINGVATSYTVSY